MVFFEFCGFVNITGGDTGVRIQHIADMVCRVGSGHVYFSAFLGKAKRYGSGYGGFAHAALASVKQIFCEAEGINRKWLHHGGSF